MDFEADLGARVTAYSQSWNVINDIVHPKKARHELKIQAQTPINKQFGLIHGLRYESRPPATNPFMPPKDPVDGTRSYHLGAYLVKRDHQGLRTMATASVGTNGDALSTLEKQFSADFRTRVAMWTRPFGAMYHAISAQYNGSDFTAEMRCANLDIAQIAYNQRLGNYGIWKNITAGGEGFFDLTNFKARNKNPTSTAGELPWYYSMSAQYADGLNRFLCGWYRPMKATASGQLQLAYARHVTDYTTLVTKAQVEPFDKNLQVFAGYKILFPRTRSVMTASIDSNHLCKAYFERRLLSNVRLGISGTVQPAPKVVPGQGPMPSSEPSRFGVHLRIGSIPPEPLNLSPGLLRNHTILHR